MGTRPTQACPLFMSQLCAVSRTYVYIGRKYLYRNLRHSSRKQPVVRIAANLSADNPPPPRPRTIRAKSHVATAIAAVRGASKPMAEKISPGTDPLPLM